MSFPIWTTENDDGLWCDFCGHHLLAPWNIEDGAFCPETCPECGAPDDGDAMARYFS